MKPETQTHLDLAEAALADAKFELTAIPQHAPMAQAAARSAYFAAFHAAAALVFERTGVLPKTHGGLNTRFHQVSQTEPAIDPVMRGFLSASYDFKTTADYGYGRTGTITSTMAAAAVQEAERFLTIIRQLLTPPATGSAPAP